MASPRNTLSAWGVHAKKKLGQNFLTDPSVPRVIVSRAGISAGDIVIEIGPGLGALTVPAAGVAEKVYAVEKDSQLVPLLRNELLAAGIDNVDIFNNDVLKVDLEGIAASHPEKVIVLGNLPYNISSQIMIRLIAMRSRVKKAVFMFQKELAERIRSGPGTKDYGRLSAVVQYCADIRSITLVDAASFFPRPKVDSEVVEISFREPTGPVADNEAFLFDVIKAAFGKRRKNLKNALTNSELGIDGALVVAALDEAGILASRRAESLSVDEFVVLSNCLFKHAG